MQNTSTQSAGLAALLNSGVESIDREWGGLYRGGAYLVFGRAASGRGLLTLRYAMTGSSAGESCLFIAPDRPKDLMIQASTIGFDLRQARQDGRLRMMRMPPVLDPNAMNDDTVARAMKDLVALVRSGKPDRLVINDFMPFVLFRSFDRFRTEFVRLLEQIDSLDTTTLFVLPEPANQQSRRVIEFMASQMTGAIHIETLPDEPSSTSRRVTLIPQMGQIRRQVVTTWDLAALSPKRSGQAVEPPAETVQTGHKTPAESPPAYVPPPPPIITAPDPTPEPPDVRFADRDRFQLRLQDLFAGRGKGNPSFLLLAMRMDDTADKAKRPFDFDFIVDLVADTLRPNDDMVISTKDERLVVLLSNSRPEEAQHFFSRLKNRLRTDAPQQADHLLHAVSAIVVPDGKPFQTATEFLSYALDEA